jgi:hypothetical protein
MSDDSQDEDMKRLRQHVDALADHFDAVQIFASRHEAGEQDGTVNIHWGAGNYFARYGQVMEWCIRADETTRNETRRKREEE